MAEKQGWAHGLRGAFFHANSRIMPVEPTQVMSGS
jgi:hypothetical protein